MAIDEATAGFLAAMAAAGPPMHLLGAPEARAATGALKDLYGPGPDMAEVRDEKVDVGGDTVLVRVLRPTDAPRGILVYFHGGGWVIGSVDEYDTLGRTLAQRTGFAVALVGYRKAPEHPYPTAVDDSWAALAWVDAHRAELAADGAPLVVAGDSAGGNLAAIMTQRARAARGPAIDAQVLVYPATRLDAESPSYHEPENQLLLNAESMAWFLGQYIPDAAAREELDASPGRAGPGRGPLRATPGRRPHGRARPAARRGRGVRPPAGGGRGRGRSPDASLRATDARLLPDGQHPPG